MKSVKGFVDKVSAKEWDDTVLYSFSLDNGEWYRTGETDHGLDQGTYVSFDYMTRKTGRGVNNTVVDGSIVVETAPAATNVAATKEVVSGVSISERDARISFAGACNTAINFVGTGMQNGLFKMPAKDGEKKYEALVDAWAEKFYQKIMSEHPITPAADDVEVE